MEHVRVQMLKGYRDVNHHIPYLRPLVVYCLVKDTKNCVI